MPDYTYDSSTGTYDGSWDYDEHALVWLGATARIIAAGEVEVADRWEWSEEAVAETGGLELGESGISAVADISGAGEIDPITRWEPSEEATAITLPGPITRPRLFVEVDYTTPPLQIPNDWVSVPRFRAISISQGRQRLLNRTEVGSATVTADNLLRAYDPTIHPEVRPGNHLRIRARPHGLGGTIIDLFRGFVRSWPQEWPGRVDAVSRVEAEDAFALMARFELEGDAIAEMGSGAHIREVLTRYGWPESGSVPEDTDWWILEDAASELGTNTFLGESLSQIDDGLATIMATDLTGNLLDHLLNVAESTEGGTLYVGPDGGIVFRQRQVGADEPIGTWGDEPGELRYTELVVTYDDSQIFNDIRITRRGDAVAATATDDDSIASYGPRTLSRSDDLHSEFTDLEEQVGRLLIKHRSASLYPQSITMRPTVDSPLWALVLGIPLGTTIVVRRRPPGAAR